jgi:hypothetical protein
MLFLMNFGTRLCVLSRRFSFVTRGGVSDWIYVHHDDLRAIWGALSPKCRIIFRIAFAFGGPNAFDVRLESLARMADA